MNGQQIVYDYLDSLSIQYEYLEHPPAPTIEIAKEYWKDLEAVHCKNLFFRNHKGNKHYLVIFNCDKNLAIKDLENRLKQGKLSFASEKRMDKYLGLKPGSVSPFGLINDHDNHVHVFYDNNLLNAERISFHPNDNTASITICQSDFRKYIDKVGNSYEFIELY